MKSLTRLLALTATIAMAGWINSASATVTLSFFIVTTPGNIYTVNTGNITAATTTKTIPLSELVGSCAPALACAGAGIVAGGPVGFSAYTLPTVNGAFSEIVTVGANIFSFTSISGSLIVPTTATSQGTISEQLNGFVTGGTLTGQTVSLSESCTQTSLGSLLSCTETVATPGLPIQTPEPTSLALLGIGLAGLGFASRRRKS